MIFPRPARTPRGSGRAHRRFRLEAVRGPRCPQGHPVYAPQRRGGRVPRTQRGGQDDHAEAPGPGFPVLPGGRSGSRDSTPPATVRRPSDAIGALVETPGVPPYLTGSDLLQYVARVKGVPAAERAEAVRRAADGMGVADHLSRSFGALSTGLARWYCFSARPWSVTPRYSSWTSRRLASTRRPEPTFAKCSARFPGRV